MYKLKKTPNNRYDKKTLLVLGFVFTALFVGILFVYWNQSKNNNITDPAIPGRNPINYAPPTEQDKAEVENNKVTDPKMKPGTDAPTPTPSSVAILSAEQDPQKNLVVQTQLNGTGWKRCSLALDNGQRTITKRADSLYQSDFSTCMGFTISAAELTSGTWTILLTGIKADGTSTTSNKKSVIIR